MIIKASQRGGAKQLARHLLNANDNEHVRVHEISGFLSESLSGALNEAYAVSKSTKCKQFLFSVSLSPPPGRDVPVEVFEEAARRIEEKMELGGQPRVLVFHEKEGRRHAHAVWSRIKAEQMKAINLPYFKNQLMEVSKELYLEHGWKLPEGFINRENRNPLNFTRDEWQQAKRLGDDPRTAKMAMQECWAITRDKDEFKRALERNGYYLAQGDRRGFVAVDWRGEVYSLSRQLGVKGADLKARLGDEKQLPTVTNTKANVDQQLAERMKDHLSALQNAHKKKTQPVMLERSLMQERHKAAREGLVKAQEKRWKEEAQFRQSRYRQGVGGLWDCVSGRHGSIRKQNEMEAYQAVKRDRGEHEQLAHSQLRERTALQRDINRFRQEHEKDKRALQEAVFSKVPQEKVTNLQPVFQDKTVQQTLNPRPIVERPASTQPVAKPHAPGKELTKERAPSLQSTFQHKAAKHTPHGPSM